LEYANATEVGGGNGAAAVEIEIERMVNEAARDGFDQLLIDRLRALLVEYENVWRVGLVVLIWIDDVILFAHDAESCLEQLRQFLEILRSHNLKLNARKCTVFSREVVWCGRVIDWQGVPHDPSRLAALRDMQLPPTTAGLQHFVCAMN
jgi:hypothetical protein